MATNSSITPPIPSPADPLPVLSPAAPLPVMERFYTLQGEGYHQGKAAYFIRLGGCDVGCVWCDVKDSWDADKHPRQSGIRTGTQPHPPTPAAWPSSPAANPSCTTVQP
jgi:hypothetical protein